MINITMVYLPDTWGEIPGFIHEFGFLPERKEIILFFFNEGNPEHKQKEHFPFREKFETILQKYR
jgi:hypothetical protein